MNKQLKWCFVIPRLTAANDSTYVFPIGVGYVCASLKKTGRIVETLNMNYKKENAYDMLRQLLVEKTVDVVAVGGLTAQYRQIAEIFSMAKCIKRETVCVCGGGLITSDPEASMLALECVDYGVIGEGEETICDLADCLDGKKSIDKVDGIIYKTSRGLERTTPRRYIPDLDLLPYPDYEGLEYGALLERMSNDIGGQGTERFGYISLSRSCPFNCTFCFHPTGSKYRQRSLKSALSEIDYLISEYNIKNLYIEDELFVANKNDLYIFCEEIKKRSLGYVIALRVDMVDQEKLILLRDSGCLSISFGIESADNRILKSMNKHITIEQIEKALSMCYELGINVIGNFIFGDIAETIETYSNTLNWWKAHPQYPIYLHPIIVYPGSEIYRYACEKKIIKDKVQFIKDGCPMINISQMSDEDYREMIVNISLETKDGDKLEDVEVTYIGTGKARIKARCPRCGEYNIWDGQDTFRNLGLLRCCKCHKSIYAIASEYVSDKVEKNVEKLRDEKVGVWPMINTVSSMMKAMPSFMKSENVFFIDNSVVKKGVKYRGKKIYSPDIIEKENIKNILITSSAPFLVEDILSMIRSEYKNVDRVMLAGDLLDEDFLTKNLLMNDNVI